MQGLAGSGRDIINRLIELHPERYVKKSDTKKLFFNLNVSKEKFVVLQSYEFFMEYKFFKNVKKRPVPKKFISGISKDTDSTTQDQTLEVNTGWTFGVKAWSDHGPTWLGHVSRIKSIT